MHTNTDLPPPLPKARAPRHAPRAIAPTGGTLSRRELRRIVAEMVG